MEQGSIYGGLGFRVEGLPGDPKNYRLMGSTFWSRGHNLLSCRVWGQR